MLPGETIDGEYRILEQVGEGGIGVVFLCEDLQLDRRVALKLLKSGDLGAKEIQQFVSEGRKLATLNHPNVVQIYRFGTHADRPYFVMEYLEGQPLREILRQTRLSMTRALEIMLEVARGLGAVHAQGIIHRDLSTNNIMITGSGTVKILDLGLSRTAGGASTSSVEGHLVGTLPYLCPEQLTHGRTTFASDIFPFGIVLYEALTGCHPYEAEHYMSMLYNIVHGAPRPLRDYLEEAPDTLVELVESCLARRPEDRPPTAAAIELVLQRILSTAESRSAVETAATAAIEVPQSALRHRKQPNPYLNRVMIKRPEDFFGRSQEVKRIYARFNATPPGSISIVGDRKIGKSSLLNYVYAHRNRRAHLENPETMVMVFLDLQQQTGMSLQSFCEVLLQMTGLELRDRLDLSDCGPLLDGIRRMVEKMDREGYRLIIILDEFEAITSNPNFSLEFFSFLRYLANHHNVGYLTSSARDLQALCHTKEISDSPFFNIFSTMRLSAFNREEAEELIAVPSERFGKPLGPYVDPIIDLAGLFPLFLQMACSHTLEYLDETGDDAQPDFEEIHRRFYEEAKFHFRYMWDRFDSVERSAIRRVVRSRSLPDSLRHVLEDLERRRYVGLKDDGARLFASTFRDFVEKETGESDKPAFWRRIFGRR